MKFLKNIFFILILILNLNSNLYSATGEATVYKITIRQIALCVSTGSSLSNCSNPVVIYTGDSGAIDIASVSAGAAAGSLGSTSSTTVGTTFSHMQIVMNRAITISGSGIQDGASNSCGTAGGTAAANASSNAAGVASAGSGELVVNTGVHGFATGENAYSPVSSITSTTGTANGTNAGESYFQWRVALTSNYVYDGINPPKVTVAFDTANALGFTGAACLAYAAAPTVTITLE